MTDKELLESAARAAGITLRHWDGHTSKFCKNPIDKNDLRNYWNPLKDDGDALRLAVKLGIGLDVSHTDVSAVFGDAADYISKTFESDPYAATRRAIVLAAAAIGEAMP